MRIDEYSSCDATALAELLRASEVTADEVYDAALGAIDEVNAEINAVAEGPWAVPMEYQRDALLSGVPFVLKSLGAHAQGVPSRLGSRLGGDGVVFSHESFLVRRFRDAGLAIAGTTTTPEFGNATTSEAVVYGATRNPWDVTRSAGGSSGGTGALVAAGAVPAGHANDGGGSIRIPAAVNGLVGLKPSRGRISAGPDGQDLGWGLACEGVLTRTVRDCAALLDVAAGPIPGDPFIFRDPQRPWSDEVGAETLRLRVAVHTASWGGYAVDPEVVAAVEAVGRTLEALGHQVSPATPRFDWDALIATMLAFGAVGCVEMVDFLSAAKGTSPSAETLEHTTLSLYDYGRALTVRDLIEARRHANEITRSLGGFFTSWDLLITPTVNTPAAPIGYLNANDPLLDAESWMRHRYSVCSFTQLFNISGTPAISVPVGCGTDGLPIGVQLATPIGDEATLIRVASMLEEAMPWAHRRPPLHAAALPASHRRWRAGSTGEDPSNDASNEMRDPWGEGREGRRDRILGAG